MLATLVKFGAPANILMDGKPHVGTDKLVLILRAFRQHMQTLGVVFLAPLPFVSYLGYIRVILKLNGTFRRELGPYDFLLPIVLHTESIMSVHPFLHLIACPNKFDSLTLNELI